MKVIANENGLGATILELPEDVENHKEELQGLLWKYKVLSIEGLENIGASRLETIASIFGEIYPLPKLTPISPDHPNIHSIERSEVETGYPLLFGGNWHSDQAWLNTRPIYTILYSLEIPNEGGDTLFIDTTALLKRLPSFVMDTLRKTEVVQAPSRYTFEEAITSNGTKSYFSYFFESREHSQEEQDTLHEHPIVKIALQCEAAKMHSVQKLVFEHPHTKEESLNINPSFTREFVGVGREPGYPACPDRLYDMLWDLQYATSPHLRLKWKVGNVVIWDNRLVVHKATPSVGKRKMWRIMMIDPVMRDNRIFFSPKSH